MELSRDDEGEIVDRRMDKAGMMDGLIHSL